MIFGVLVGHTKSWCSVESILNSQPYTREWYVDIGCDFSIGTTPEGVRGQEMNRSHNDGALSRHLIPGHNYPWPREAKEARVTTSLVTPSIAKIGQFVSRALGSAYLHGHSPLFSSFSFEAAQS